MHRMIGLSDTSYDGTSDPNEFERLFMLQAATFDWDVNKQYEVLPLCIQGKAKNAFLDWVTKGTVTNIKTALAAIKKDCALPQEFLMNQFCNRTLRKDESVANYALALQELLRNAVPNICEVWTTRLHILRVIRHLLQQRDSSQRQ